MVFQPLVGTEIMRASYQISERGFALAYVEDQLASGKTLSSFLLRAVQRQDGELSYLSPRPLSPAEAVQFETGHTFDYSSPVAMKVGNISGIAYPTPNTDQELGHFVQKVLSEADHIALLEHSLAAPSDPWLERAKSRVLVHEDEVYHLALCSEQTHDDIQNAIREANNVLRMVGMVGRIPGAVASLAPAKRLSLAQVEMIGINAECVFVSAFDGEGYVIWEKN
jgi:hypothetical protein